MDGADVHATRSSVGKKRSILLKPSGERDDLVGAGAGAGAGVLSAAAAIGVRDSGDCWRLRGETSEQMFARAQGIRERYGPIARNLLLPQVPQQIGESIHILQNGGATVSGRGDPPRLGPLARAAGQGNRPDFCLERVAQHPRL
jgi:hypothetical protein